MRTFIVIRILDEEYIIVKKDTWKSFLGIWKEENCKSFFGGYILELIVVGKNIRNLAEVKYFEGLSLRRLLKILWWR